MSNTNTGGPAFPMTGMDFRNGQQVEAVHQKGMTLRDYFAAQAIGVSLQACVGFESAAEDAYMMADSMLKAREA